MRYMESSCFRLSTASDTTCWSQKKERERWVSRLPGARRTIWQDSGTLSRKLQHGYRQARWADRTRDEVTTRRPDESKSSDARETDCSGYRHQDIERSRRRSWQGQDSVALGSLLRGRHLEQGPWADDSRPSTGRLHGLRERSQRFVSGACRS